MRKGILFMAVIIVMLIAFSATESKAQIFTDFHGEISGPGNTYQETTVILYHNGTLLATTTSDNDGEYFFPWTVLVGSGGGYEIFAQKVVTPGLPEPQIFYNAILSNLVNNGPTEVNIVLTSTGNNSTL